MKTEQVAERWRELWDEVKDGPGYANPAVDRRKVRELIRELSAAEAERDRLREAVSLMYDAMTDKAGAWIRARIWLDAHDIYHGDLQENAVLAEVCRAALDAGKEQPHDV
jgi:hypothetical protein